jgi:copper homeostasis protein
MTIEIVVYNLESALMAKQGGADRIELCDNPGEGGTTPSLGMIQRVREKANLDLFVMIRPRGGDFLYSPDEFEVMKTDIMAAKRAGAEGVVFGILTADGRIDTARCTELIQLSRPMQVTCHRAFDMTRDLSQAMEDCIGCGYDRILTSGGKLRAIDGVDTLACLNRQAQKRISIMPGSGVSEENVLELVSKTGVAEIHFSAVSFRESDMTWQNKTISGMGNVQNAEFLVRTVHPGKILNIRMLAEKLS